MINMQDRSIATYPAAVWKLIGAGCDQLMHPSITYDEVLQMTEDNVQREDSSLMTFADLGIEPTTMERVAFDYLHRFRVGGHFKVVQGYHTKDILGKHGVGGSH
jgi:NADH dehydrogenase (ubiquinone) 1 alpha subcomplex subunit 9